MVLNEHRPVVVNRRVAGDDADDGGRNFLPGVEFLTARGWAELQEPGAQRVDVEGFAVEFGLDGGFAVVVPFGGFGPGGADRGVVGDLLNEEAVAFIWTDVFVCFAQERIERFGDAADGGGVFAGCECCYIDHTFGRVGSVCCCIKQICVFHVFSDTLE